MAFRCLAFLLLVCAALAGCSAYQTGMGGGGGYGGGAGGAIIKGTGYMAGSSTAGMSISNYTFDPSPLPIPAAKMVTVTWTNNDSFAHTVTSDTGAFDSGSIPPGGTFSRQFLSTGTFFYHCSIHTFRKGSVQVN